MSLDAIMARRSLREVFDIFGERGWKVKLTVWKADGETWEITPVAKTQVRRGSVPAKNVEWSEPSS